MVKKGDEKMIKSLLKNLMKPEEKHKLGLKANRVVIEIRRAKKDKDGNTIRDAQGNVVYHDKIERYENHNVTCTAGINAARDRLFNSATSETTAHYIALTEDTAAPAAADTELASEITLSGLARAAGTYSTAGCSDGECIVSKTFTATANVSAVVKMGLFDDSSAGTMYFEATIASASLVTDDQLTAKWDKITVA